MNEVVTEEKKVMEYFEAVENEEMKENSEKGKIALYTRLSIEDMNICQSESINNQLEILYDFVKRNKEFQHLQLEEYIDDGYTGTNFNRPAFMKMIEDIKQRKISVVIIKDLSRFGRDYLTVGNYLENVFPFLGVRCISIADNFDSALESGNFNIEIVFKNLFNGYYSKDLSKKIQSIFDSNKRKGYNTHCIYGYELKNGQWIIDPKSSQVVKLIFNKALEGNSAEKIAAYLSTINIPTSADYRKLKKHGTEAFENEPYKIWSGIAVERILKDERYAGVFIEYIAKEGKLTKAKKKSAHLSEKIIIENHHEAIISKSEFKKVKSMRKNYSGRIYKRDNMNILRNKLVCGHCGYVLNFTRARRDNRENDYGLVNCRNGKVKGAGGCTKEHVKVAIIENVVLEELKKMAEITCKAEELFKQILIKQKSQKGDIQEKLDEIRKKLDKMKNDKMGLYEAYKEEKFTREEYLIKKKELDTALMHSNEKIHELEVELQAEKSRKNKCDFLEKFKGIEDMEKLTEEVVMEFVEKVRLFDGKRVEIEWKFGDEMEKLKGLTMSST